MIMRNKSYSELKENSAFEGENAAYLEELYERYLEHPSSLSKEWQEFFDNSYQKSGTEPLHSEVRQRFLDLARRAPAASPQAVANGACDFQLKVSHLIQAYRQFGHLRAKTDPLYLSPQSEVAALTLAHYGLSINDSTRYHADGLAGLESATLAQIVSLCEKIYCGPIGFEFSQVDHPDELAWLRNKAEAFSNWALPKQEKLNLLKELTATEGLEKTLGTKYVGVTRFSAEGGDSQIPLLNYLIQHSASLGVKEVMIGMAHRGRLNVLVNVLGMPVQDIFDQFEGKYHYAENRSDDVKYHYGYSADLKTSAGPMHASVSFNPSHLEIVSPVAQGAVRARQDALQDEKREQVLAIQLHGDSAFAGQGVVMETFALSQTRGFKVGGSFHVVINNQVGFTTSNPQDTRSSLYCTDAAKIVNAPVFHVNGDHPEAVLFVTQLGLEYHTRFHKDVVIDLVCYRRYGHNEGDEPSATQPLMYQAIRKLPTTRKIYADQLIREGIVTDEAVTQMMDQYRAGLDHNQGIIEHTPNPIFDKTLPDWSKYQNTRWDAPAKTALTKNTLGTLAKALVQLPEGFKLQAQVAKIFATRAAAYGGTSPILWGDAEVMAYASLLEEGYPVRLVGQDSGRGTFAHRHATVYDQATGQPYTPLQHLSDAQAGFTVVDSVLSENAVMGFEYGYANMSPHTLVLWEAQYGDFSNGAQVVIDQFLSAGEQKWGQYAGLVLLLPHAYEGMGPEHSSARLERYLQLCAQDNMQVCVPTTPAQIFHVLRRQMIRPYRKPLIILTPKSFLRRMTSPVEDLLQGEFQPVIPDALVKPASTKRVLICSGKIYYELQAAIETRGIKNIAMIRLEQLYPFPREILTQELKKYSQVQDIVWCQEEPKNQGAWLCIREFLEACLQKGQTLTYVGRAASASTAAGYKKLHEKEQLAVIDDALKTL